MDRFTVMSYAWHELSRRKIRTLVNVFGYGVAIAAVVVMVSLAKPRIENQTHLLLTLGTHLIGFIPDPAYPPDKGMGPCAQGVYTTMMHAATLQSIQGMQGMKAVAPYILFQEQNFLNNTTVTIGGLDLSNMATQINVCPPGDVIDGRHLDQTDTDAVMLAESYAAATHRGVGDAFEAFGRTFQVVGIVNTAIRAVKANIYATISVVREILVESKCGTAETGDFNVALVEVSDARLMEDVRRSLERYLADEPTGGVDPITGAEVVEKFAELNRSEGVTVVVTTHGTFPPGVATRMLFMEQGALVAREAAGPLGQVT